MISEKRKTQLKESLSCLEALSWTLDGLMYGDMSMAQAAKAMHVTEFKEDFQPDTGGMDGPGQFLHEMHHIVALLPNEMHYVLQKRPASPHERLFRAVFGAQMDYDREHSIYYTTYTLVSEKAAKTLENAMEARLTDLERQAVQLHFGFYGRPHGLSEVKDICGLNSRGKAGEVITKAMKKLRAREIWESFCPTFQECRGLRTEMDALLETREILKKAVGRMEGALMHLPDVPEGLRTPKLEQALALMEKLKQRHRERFSDMPVAELGISTRLENSLRRAGYMTVGSILQETKAHMLSLPKFGKVCVAELECALGLLGLGFQEGE